MLGDQPKAFIVTSFCAISCQRESRSFTGSAFSSLDLIGEQPPCDRLRL